MCCRVWRRVPVLFVFVFGVVGTPNENYNLLYCANILEIVLLMTLSQSNCSHFVYDWQVRIVLSHTFFFAETISNILHFIH